MAMYKMKALEVEAMVLNENNHDEMMTFIEDYFVYYINDENSNDDVNVIVSGDFDTIYIHVGDYVVKEPKGKLRVYTKEEFEYRFEPTLEGSLKEVV